MLVQEEAVVRRELFLLQRFPLSLSCPPLDFFETLVQDRGEKGDRRAALEVVLEEKTKQPCLLVGEAFSHATEVGSSERREREGRGVEKSAMKLKRMRSRSVEVPLLEWTHGISESRMVQV